MTKRDSFHVAVSVADAIAALVDRGRSGVPLAGATWVMRAPIRKERHDYSFVALSRIEELRHVAIGDGQLSIGACVTHDQLATALAPLPEFRALAMAAGGSANPAIRQAATVGGNICAYNFPAADLVPAFICLDAGVELATAARTELVPIEKFLALRSDLDNGCLVRRVIVPRKPCRSTHARLTLRKAGDYPVAIVSLAVDTNPAGVVKVARVAIGSVEATARRWTDLEDLLIGKILDPDDAAEKAQHCSDAFQGRDGIEAPGWYRVKVLSSLVRRAVHAVQSQR